MKFDSDAESRYRLQRYEPEPPIEGVRAVELRRFHDAGGSMMELLRFEQPPEGLAGFVPRQLNYSVVQPGTIKAFHVHRRQTDVWFVPPEDRILLVLVDVRDGSPTRGRTQTWMLGDGNARWVVVPPGVAHGCRNLGTDAARILYLTDLTFDPDPTRCDEGRLPWDFAGADVWDVPKE